ncbi:MAG: fumarylacetoacetate hydrolase family protein [Bacillota bacterium]
MILVTYGTPHGLALGMKLKQGVLDIAAARERLGAMETPATPEALFQMGSAALPLLESLAARAAGYPELFMEESQLQLGPPVPAPSKLICIGLNYRKHALESKMAIPTSPVVFSKFANAIAGPGDEIPLPGCAQEYDYEAELVAVIGRRARNVSVAEALDYVLGYCNSNDLTARDLQFRTSQWLLGKSLDRFMPLGPYLVTADQMGDPQALQIRLWLNGELRQESSTADMIFSVAEVVSYLSQHMTLEPGDLISTGTPEGVIMGMAERVWLKPGDRVEVEVEGLGRLTNTMVAES